MTRSRHSFADFFRSPRFPIFMIVFVDVLGLGITLPVLPLFAQDQLGAAASQITILTSVFFGAQFLASPWLGRLSDRFGRRPVLIFSQVGTLMALLITGLAPAMIFLYAARLIDGFTGGNISVAQAYLSDITDEKNRAHGLGTINASFGLGFVFGPAFGSLVASFFGPRVPFFIAACVSVGTILLSIFLLKESLTPERRKHEQAMAQAIPQKRGWEIALVPSVMILLFVAFFSQFGFFTFQTTFVLWAQKILFPGYPDSTTQQAIGAILTFVGICGIITQFWLVGPLVRRFGERKLVVGGNVARALAFGAMALTQTVSMTFVSVPLLSIGGGVALPALIALMTYAAPPDGRGQVIGLNQSVSAMGSILGPIVAGFLFENVHPNAPMIAASAIMAVTTLIALNIFRVPLYQPSAMPAPQPILVNDPE